MYKAAIDIIYAIPLLYYHCNTAHIKHIHNTQSYIYIHLSNNNGVVQIQNNDDDRYNE
jgi:hypothetical protein